MLLNKPEHELRSDFQNLASDLRWSAVELKGIAERLRQTGSEVDAEALLKTCQVLETAEERLATYADEVKAHRISLK
ncbi:hypothetical protein BLL42_01665 [Pseudomonas frederiksbergensis]|uniref:Uncharacterized protein n=1 Tax=Pseudomonas frederiksbergensis TaxID=104087 RepID=A0A1J0EF36_9PSED|nr:hypothetical protein [Pseudomonas frederiksbergensis]APC14504.1 hypothetical protein BLL42_01665 [Pseudomonas frederiksbergensis]